VYVDDCIILSRSHAVIDRLVSSLKNGKKQFNFTDDEDLRRHLGVEMERRSDGCLELRQEFLIKRILEAAVFLMVV